MARPQISIAALIGLVAVAAVVLGVLRQPWDQAQSILLTFALVGLPSGCVALRFGPDRWRAGALRFLATLFHLFYCLLTVAFVVAAGIVIFVAAMRTQRELATYFILTSTLVGLLVATFSAWRGLGPRRTFWWGFAIFGWSYISAGFVSIIAVQVPVLLSTSVLHEVYPELSLVAYPPHPPYHPTLRTGPQFSVRFQLMGHCLIGLLVATAGGNMARLLADRFGPGRIVEAADDPDGQLHLLAPLAD